MSINAMGWMCVSSACRPPSVSHLNLSRDARGGLAQPRERLVQRTHVHLRTQHQRGSTPHTRAALTTTWQPPSRARMGWWWVLPYLGAVDLPRYLPHIAVQHCRVACVVQGQHLHKGHTHKYTVYRGRGNKHLTPLRGHTHCDIRGLVCAFVSLLSS
jgi:hypothetical protein